MPADVPLEPQQQALQEASDILEIRDIHLPDPVSWWPPALGWWLLLSGVILLIVLSLWLWRRSLKKRASAKFLAQQELARLEQVFQTNKNASQLVKDLSVLMRRSCVSIFPREECAGLTGDTWLTFLDSRSANKGFSTALGKQLIAAAYSEKVNPTDLESDDLIALCKNWLEGLP